MDEDTKQVTEVSEQHAVGQDGAVSRHAVSTKSTATASSSVVASRVVWYIAGFIIALLAIRIILFLLGANAGSGFADFVYSLSGVFAAPFNGIFPTPAYGSFALDTASIVAIIVYALVAWGISKLFTISRPAGTADV